MLPDEAPDVEPALGQTSGGMRVCVCVCVCVFVCARACSCGEVCFGCYASSVRK